MLYHITYQEEHGEQTTVDVLAQSEQEAIAAMFGNHDHPEIIEIKTEE